MYNDEWNFTVHIEVAVDQGHICVSQVTIAISIGLVEEEVSLTSVSKLIQSQPIVLKLRSRHFLVICEIKKNHEVVWAEPLYLYDQLFATKDSLCIF